MSPGSSAPAMPNLHIEVTEQQHPLPVKHTGSSGNLLPGSPGSADSQRAAPGHAFFGALDEPPVAREAKTPDFGMPMTRHPIDASQKKAAVLAIPDEALEHTEPDSDADHARRRLCQDVLDAAPVLADGGFELASGSGEDQHPLVALAKKAIRALQVDKDPAKFADCFDDHAEIVWHRVAQGKETHKITDREGFEMFARELISHGFTCLPSPTPPGSHHPIHGFSLRGPTLSVPMHVRMETTTARYFPPTGLVPGAWIVRMRGEKLGYWEFEPAENAVRRMMWGREMDAVPILDFTSGQKGDEKLGETIKKLARSQLMGDVDTFASCFHPERGRMVTIIDASGRVTLRRHGTPASVEEKVVFEGHDQILSYAKARRAASAYFLSSSPIFTRSDGTAEVQGFLFMDKLAEHYPNGMPGKVLVRGGPDGLLEEVEFVAV